jgi:hypothetical protein
MHGGHAGDMHSVLAFSNTTGGRVTLESVPRSIPLATSAFFIGVVLWFTGIPLATVSFDHHNAVPYSCWNHTISEFGFPFVSPLTWVYNGTLAIGSLMFLPTVYGVSARLGSRLAYVAGGTGFVACVALCGIGIFGLNQDVRRTPYVFVEFLRIHMTLANVFFLGCAVTVTLFTVAFCRRWKYPASRMMALVGIFGCFVYAAALTVVFHPNPTQVALLGDLRNPAFRALINSPSSASILTPWLDMHRPHIWWLAGMEWLWASSILLWLSAALAFLWMEGAGGHSG